MEDLDNRVHQYHIKVFEALNEAFRTDPKVRQDFKELNDKFKDDSWDEQLDAVERDIAELEWTIERDQKHLKALRIYHQEVCGEVGHSWDEDFYTICVNCGAANEREPLEYEPDHD